ncbi:MAG: hypothetical protein ACR2JY_24400, partial [Chloroflexota bacterium]
MAIRSAPDLTLQPAPARPLPAAVRAPQRALGGAAARPGRRHCRHWPQGTLADQSPAALLASLPPTSAPPGAFGLGTGAARELPALRTRTSRTVVTAQGLVQTTIAPGSLNYQDQHGAWQPIDDMLVPDATAGYAYTNRANRYQLQLPSQLGASPIQLSLAGQTLGFTALGAGGRPTLAGTSASYANAWPGVDVTDAAVPDGLKENLTLASAAAPHAFSFRLSLSSGLSATAQPDGSIRIGAAQGTLVFTLPAPSMQDRSRRPAGRSRAVTRTLGPGGSAPTLAADPAWLADPARVYPVRIDPSVTLAPPTQDCYLVGGSYAASSFCGLPFLEAGWDGTEALRPLLQFNVA